MSESSLTPKGEQNSLSSEVNSNLNFRLARDQVVHLENATSLCVSGKKANNFFAVMAATKRG